MKLYIYWGGGARREENNTLIATRKADKKIMRGKKSTHKNTTAAATQVEQYNKWQPNAWWKQNLASCLMLNETIRLFRSVLFTPTPSGSPGLQSFPSPST